MNLDDFSVLYQEIPFAAPSFSSLPGVANFFYRDHRNDHLEVRMWKHLREVNQLIEETQDRSLLWTPTCVTDTAIFAGKFDQPLARHDRFHNVNQIAFVAEVQDLAPNRGKTTALNFDQPLSVDDVDAISAKLDFNFRTVVAKDLFQLVMQRVFHRLLFGNYRV